jgi:hypothetical protein
VGLILSAVFYTAEMLEMCDVPGMFSSWNHAVLFQNLRHNLIKSEFHVRTNYIFIFFH